MTANELFVQQVHNWINMQRARVEHSKTVIDNNIKEMECVNKLSAFHNESAKLAQDTTKAYIRELQESEPKEVLDMEVDIGWLINQPTKIVKIKDCKGFF